MSADGVWPLWLARIHSVLLRGIARVADAATHLVPGGRAAVDEEWTAISLQRVLRLLLIHEHSKHPASLPPGLIVDDAPDDEGTLSSLLQTAGWPAHRVRRISELHWHQAMLSGHRLERLHLAAVPWVLQFGRGSTRASDVARGVAHALRSGQWDDHLAAITRAITEPPYPRVLVLRVRRRSTVVEDGNHFVVASLLQYPDPEERPPVTSLLGQRPRSAPVLSVGQQTEVARRTIKP